MVGHVEGPGQGNLLEVVQADDREGLGFGPMKRAQNHGGQQSDDRDHNEQFDEREGGSSRRSWPESYIRLAGADGHPLTAPFSILAEYLHIPITATVGRE